MIVKEFSVNNKVRQYLSLTVLFVLCFLAAHTVSAQEAVAPQAAAPKQNQEAENQSTEGEEIEVIDKENEELLPTEIPSILFTKWEYEAIMDALSVVGTAKVRAPTSSELRDADKLQEERFKVRPPPEERDITLNGLVYGGKNDWTIWLNGSRVTPGALPKEVIDLRVYKEFIEMKWFDDYSQTVYPIRLKPHQRFNLDTRIFLPG